MRLIKEKQWFPLENMRPMKEKQWFLFRKYYEAHEVKAMSSFREYYEAH